MKWKVEIQENLEYEFLKRKVSNRIFEVYNQKVAYKKYYYEDIDINKLNNDFNLLNE